ncbi:TPA: DUF4145 domain-containing protein [Campylobacter coli]|uniref:DUF4145 domain-containing protein n=1 Tax=Campylobacter coli TaxID=195 RepID=UPI0024DE838B|nr:DUF4145 domain-containing protein [Campylobacter coli]EHC5633111.1 DUF4145 domain-containing protein [Campylobacter coli]EIC9915297.1 DUF4145 domain-containing protein [Campylobacter coli]EID5127909.1 DUF4145 domain-containing protein [Campylobacter coli]EID5173153.1 DUF4145 domain-containing protein [Campylobacter coli]EIE4102499.1 DUF4145 domain-containing protein [Campylobacter coli]
MEIKYYPPVFRQDSFHCPHCNVYSHIKWEDTCLNFYHVEYLCSIAFCNHCKKYSIWLNETKEMLYPKTINVPLPNEDLKENIKQIYNEAAIILNDSPRAACALMRLALQELMKELGEKGKDLASDILNLKNKGLDEQIIKACEIVRIVGNNAVHPGIIDINDNPEIAYCLFEMINLIAEKLITQKIKTEKLFNKIQNLKNKKPKINP